MSDDTVQNAGGAGASRGLKGGSRFTALKPTIETRQLKIAYGIQFHPGESLPVSHQQFLDKNLELSDNLEKISDSEYLNHLQGVRFTIEVTTSKQKFIEWLKTPALHVIYMGHARHGRGPCFGAHGIDDRGSLVKTQDWEQGTDDDSGIFRMGYPLIGVEISELLGHGYTANALKESDGRPARADCDPYLRGYLGSLKALSPDEIYDKLDKKQERRVSQFGGRPVSRLQERRSLLGVLVVARDRNHPSCWLAKHPQHFVRSRYAA